MEKSIIDYWQGKKIRLRSVEPGDADAFIHWNHDSERARHLDFVWPPVSDASVRSMCEERSKQHLENDEYHWVIETLDGAPVGSLDTHHCDHRNGTFSYGVDVAAEHRGNGYASEAIVMVLRYYFDELRYQKAGTEVHADNEASIHLHEKLGFQLEGRHRRTAYLHGRYVDGLWYGMTIEEFHALYS